MRNLKPLSVGILILKSGLVGTPYWNWKDYTKIYRYEVRDQWGLQGPHLYKSLQWSLQTQEHSATTGWQAPVSDVILGLYLLYIVSSIYTSLLFHTSLFKNTGVTTKQ